MKMFPACFLGVFTVNILSMIDAMLSGYFFSPLHIAAIGVVAPVTIAAAAVMNAVSSGVEIGLSIALGKGQKEEANRIYSLGMVSAVILCALFLVASEIFAPQIVGVCGAMEEDLVSLAAYYLRFLSPYFLFLGIKLVFTSILSVYGYQTEVMLSTCVELVLNIVLSVALASFTGMGIAALGAGSSIATFLSIFFTYGLMRRRKIPVRVHVYRFRLREVTDLVKHGFPTSADSLVDGFASGIINNVLSVFLGSTGLAVYSVVNSVEVILLTVVEGMRSAMRPMIGVFYGERDKNGVKKTMGEGLKITFLYTAVWVVLILITLPFLMEIYLHGSEAVGMEDVIRSGVYFLLAFAPAVVLVYIMGGFYQAMERPFMSLAFSLIPDSIVMPLTIYFLTKELGYTGTWIAYSSCELIFFLFAIPVFLIYKRTLRPTADDVLFLNGDIRDHVPMKDISIRYSNTDISGLSADIQKFLSDNGAKGRTAYMCALCLEELAADFIAHSEITEEKIKENSQFMDIKLFSDDDSFRMLIRNTAGAYNPLDFTYDPEDFSKIGVYLAQKVAKKIYYNYVYKMNIITIDVAK